MCEREVPGDDAELGRLMGLSDIITGGIGVGLFVAAMLLVIFA